MSIVVCEWNRPRLEDQTNFEMIIKTYANVRKGISASRNKRRNGRSIRGIIYLATYQAMEYVCVYCIEVEQLATIWKYQTNTNIHDDIYSE